MKQIRTENGGFTVKQPTGERPSFAVHLTEGQYLKFIRVYLKHATSYSSLEKRAEYELDKVSVVRAWDNGTMIIDYANGESFKFPPNYA